MLVDEDQPLLRLGNDVKPPDLAQDLQPRPARLPGGRLQLIHLDGKGALGAAFCKRHSRRWQGQPGLLPKIDALCQTVGFHAPGIPVAAALLLQSPDCCRS